MTACLKHENLPEISKSIIESQHQNPDFSICWLIIIDQYNSTLMQMSEETQRQFVMKLHNSLIENDIQHVIEYSGKPGQKNYGGDMFNEPLKRLQNTPIIEDSMLYILDDDNIVHPLLLPTIKRALAHGFNRGRILWLTKQSEYGYIAEAVRENAYAKIEIPNGDEWRCWEVFCLDPSQAVQWVEDVYNWKPNNSDPDYPGAGENGMFPNGFAYDSALYLGRYEIEPESFMFFTDFLESSYWVHDIPSTYHNGLRTNRDYIHYRNLLSENSNEIVAAHFSVSGDNSYSKIFPVSKELARKIFDLILEENEKKKH